MRLDIRTSRLFWKEFERLLKRLSRYLRLEKASGSDTWKPTVLFHTVLPIEYVNGKALGMVDKAAHYLMVGLILSDVVFWFSL